MKKKRDNSSRVQITPYGIDVFGKEDWYQIANFGLDLRYCITDSRGNVTWQLEILTGKERFPIEMTNEDFATPARFHAAILKKGFVFKGEKYELNLVKEELIPRAKRAERIDTLGRHKSGLYFFVNGAFDGKAFITPNEFGMVEHDGSAYFLPYAIDLKQYKSVSRFIYLPESLTLNNWLALFRDAYGEAGLLPFCFYVASLFRDIAYSHAHCFPILYLEGIRGTGKSSMARNLTALFGYPQAEISLIAPNTPKSLPRLLEQMSNALLWFDEYRNDLPPDIRAIIQAIYDGGGYHRANNTQDNSTNSVDVLSGIVLTSNYTPDNDIFLSRVVCVYMNDPTKTDAQKKAFDALRSYESTGLSSITASLLQHRAVIETHYRETHHAIYEALRKQTAGIDSRVLQNLAAIVAPAQILIQQKVLNLKAIFKGADLKTLAANVATAQQQLLVGKSELSHFFDIIAAGIESQRLKVGIDFVRIKPKGKPICLALRLGRLMSFYQKEFRATANKIGHSRQEIEQLAKAHPAFVDDRYKVHFQNEAGNDSPTNALLLDYDAVLRMFDLQISENFFIPPTPKNDEKTSKKPPQTPSQRAK